MFVIALTAIPLCVVAAHGLGEVRRLLGRFVPRIAAASAVLAAFAVLTSGLYALRNEERMGINTGNGPAVFAGEVAGFAKLGGLVRPGERVLNDRGDDSVWMYALAGRFNDYDTNRNMRAAAHRLHIRYVVLGRWEIPAADAYRSLFINLADCAELIASLWPAKRILEVGCGDGSFAERLLTCYPDAHYVGIDVAENPGDCSAATRHAPSSTACPPPATARPSRSRLTWSWTCSTTCRPDLLRDVRALTVPGRHYAVKEWQPTRTLGH